MQTNKIIFSVPLKGQEYVEDVKILIQHLQTLDFWNPDILYLIEQDGEYGKELIRQFGGNWFGYTCNTDMNYPRMMNITIKAAQHNSYILNVLADFRLPKNYLKIIDTVLQENKNNYNLIGPSIRFEIPNMSNYPSNPKIYPTSTWHLTKTETQLRCMLLTKELGLAIRGFDENYIGWSAPDGDFERRVILSTLGKVIIDNRLTYAHIDHLPRPWKQDTTEITKYYNDWKLKPVVSVNQNRDWGIWENEWHNV